MTEPTVHVVDDDGPFLAATSRLLRASGYAVKTHGSANEFLAHCETDEPGCAVTDLQMPEIGGLDLRGMSGIALAKLLLAGGGHAPVIYLTAHDDPETRADAEAAGCAAYFRKNDSGADVLEAIRRVTA